MDETTKKIIDSITITTEKARQTNAGHSCRIYFDCQSLSPTELARLAAQAVGHVSPGTFEVAVGIAYAGIYFAAAVAGGHHTAILQNDGVILGPSLRGKRVVVVDDVIKSGSRMLEAGQMITKAGATLVGFACIIDRSNGTFMPTNGLPLWSAFQTTME